MWLHDYGNSRPLSKAAVEALLADGSIAPHDEISDDGEESYFLARVADEVGQTSRWWAEWNRVSALADTFTLNKE
jgi:hypothetical protein